MPTGISYLDEVWQPITGCSPCSPGCENCYAATMAQTGRLRNHRRYRGLTKHTKTASGLVVGKWTGEVRCNEEDLTQPLRWKKPRTIGVCFMGDLFHPDVPFAFLDKVFAVMALCPQHTFVTCTKRAERMREYLTGSFADIAWRVNVAARELTANDSIAVYPTQTHGMVPYIGWPPPNTHLGVTVESSEQLSRMVDLSETPAAFRWVSVEPMIGEVDFQSNVLRKTRKPDAIILGCESGPNRRPFDLDWARQVRDDCQAAGVKLYVKQLSIDGKVVTDPALFPEDLRSRELAWRVNK